MEKPPPNREPTLEDRIAEFSELDDTLFKYVKLLTPFKDRYGNNLKDLIDALKAWVDSERLLIGYLRHGGDFTTIYDAFVNARNMYVEAYNYNEQKPPMSSDKNLLDVACVVKTSMEGVIKNLAMFPDIDRYIST